MLCIGSATFLKFVIYYKLESHIECHQGFGCKYATMWYFYLYVLNCDKPSDFRRMP